MGGDVVAIERGVARDGGGGFACQAADLINGGTVLELDMDAESIGQSGIEQGGVDGGVEDVGGWVGVGDVQTAGCAAVGIVGGEEGVQELDGRYAQGRFG